LDTYDKERRPVATDVLGLTDKLVGLLTMRNPVKRAVRDTVLPLATSLPVVQRRTAGRLSQTGVVYGRGPLVRPDNIRRGPKPGQRCPDLEVRAQGGTARLHRLLRSGRHVLLVTGTASAAAASAVDGFTEWVDVVEADLGAAFTLVRPDGVVAVRGARNEIGRILEYLHQLVADDELALVR
jgi:4,5-epoxidase